MKVRIAQCLCPRRHAIIGFALNDPDTTDDEAHTMLVQAVQLLLLGGGKHINAPVETINPWCGLCGAKSNTWLYEVKQSQEFTDWDQAQEALKEFETRQMLIQAVADLLGVSYDFRRKTRMN